MSKKVNTTSIGLFIVAGLALGVIGLLLFSSSKMFSKTKPFIVYFNDSLNGLSEGAPVKYRGVTIGSVKRVMVQFNQATNDYTMPVVCEIEEKLVQQRLGTGAEKLLASRTTEEKIKAGLRATLQTESLVTGVLYVDLQTDPKAPPPVFHQLEKIYTELPSQPTQIQQLFNNLATLDLKGLQSDLHGLITELNQTITGLKTAEINRGLTNLLASVNALLTNPDLTNGFAGIRPTLDQFRDLGAKVASKVDPLADGITNSLAEANRTLAQIRGAGENLKLMIGPNSPIRNDLDMALQHLAAAGQSMSALADFLKEHPNALVAGRQLPRRNP